MALPKEPWEKWFADHRPGGGSLIGAGAAQELTWSARNVSVAKEFELSLPIVDTGVVRFHFTSTGGDLAFAVGFVPHTAEKKEKEGRRGQGAEEGEANGSAVALKGSKTKGQVSPIYVEEETLRGRAREQSHRAPVEGEVKVLRPGTLHLQWDNLGAPWRLDRTLAYSVSLLRGGSASLAKEAQAKAARSLRRLAKHRGGLEKRGRDLAALAAKCGAAEHGLEAQLAALTEELRQLRGTRSSAAALAVRVDHEVRALRNRVVATALNLVLQAGWLG